jgi:hypothetical protein
VSIVFDALDMFRKKYRLTPRAMTSPGRSIPEKTQSLEVCPALYCAPDRSANIRHDLAFMRELSRQRSLQRVVFEKRKPAFAFARAGFQVFMYQTGR